MIVLKEGIHVHIYLGDHADIYILADLFGYLFPVDNSAAISENVESYDARMDRKTNKRLYSQVTSSVVSCLEIHRVSSANQIFHSAAKWGGGKGVYIAITKTHPSLRLE